MRAGHALFALSQSSNIFVTSEEKVRASSAANRSSSSFIARGSLTLVATKALSAAGFAVDFFGGFAMRFLKFALTDAR
jgi:hypothetical protein